MRNFDCVIFDVDGTLVSTLQLIFDSFNHVAEKHLGKRFTDDEIIAMFGPTEEELLKELFNDSFKEAENNYFDFYSSNHQEQVNIFIGIKELIEELKHKGIKLAVFTGKGRRSTNITLEKAGFNNLFEITITGDDVLNHKPSGEGIQKIVDYFGVQKSRTLMIGDSTHDVIAAKSAGIRIASVLWDSFAADEIRKMNPDVICPDINSLNIFLQKNT